MHIPWRQYSSLLSAYLMPQAGQVVGLVILLLSSIGLQVLNPQILGAFIDFAVTGRSTQTLLVAALLFIGVTLLSQGLIIAATYWSEIVAWTATNALRFELVHHCLHLDLSFHHTHTPGELLERVDGDVLLLSRFFSQLVIHVFGNSILLLGILVALFWEDWRAGLSLSLFAALALLLLLGLRSLAVEPWITYRQIGAEFFGFVGEYWMGRADIRTNGAVGYVMHRFYGLLRRWLPAYQKARFASTVLWTTSVGLFTLGNVIALAVASYLWQRQAITIGTTYLIFHYTNLLNQPIERIREEIEELQQVEASIYRIRELLETTSRLQPHGQASLPAGALSVSFRQVDFRYEPRQENQRRESDSSVYGSIATHLQQLSFYLPPGHTLGLIGHTGSGKSTIARLLLRFYDIQSGDIEVGGVSIAQIPLVELRQRVGLVTQHVQLFRASVRDNLTFFTHIQDHLILETLNDLGLTAWLDTLTDGLDTVLGAEGHGLSAGQAQLLAFARVFLKNPDLVILDEASSRLDPATEQLIERAIDRLLRGRTGIIIAHRLQAVRRADQILILERGNIVEYGDQSTLARHPNSRFAQLLNASLECHEL